MFGLKPFELLLIFLVVLILFGPNKLPGLGKGLGSAIRGFKRSLSGVDEVAFCPNCKVELPKALAPGEHCFKCGYTQPTPQLQSPQSPVPPRST